MLLGHTVPEAAGEHHMERLQIAWGRGSEDIAEWGPPRACLTGME